MIQWCTENLTPVAPRFQFHHHDVHYEGFNPGADKPIFDRLPFGDGEFSLIVSISVFTHLTQDQAESYLAELARLLAPEGVLLCTWFLFDKRFFPMMQESQNTLFINEHDVRNAVIFDRAWLIAAAARAGLTIYEARAPTIRGFQWELRLTPARDGVRSAQWPEDLAPLGRRPPPPLPRGADRIGVSPG
jgi:SAM-dependent methyltransferase